MAGKTTVIKPSPTKRSPFAPFQAIQTFRPSTESEASGKHKQISLQRTYQQSDGAAVENRTQTR